MHFADVDDGMAEISVVGKVGGSFKRALADSHLFQLLYTLRSAHSHRMEREWSLNCR